MMRCQKCGTEVPSQCVFCYVCGSKLIEENSVCNNSVQKNESINNHKNDILGVETAMPKEKDINIAGTVYSNVSDASTIYGETKFCGARGHGFAAERANHLYDKVTGKDAKLVGDDNVKNGPDRIVDGTVIQTKYCASGSKCIGECFKDGKFRYVNSDGTPMQIEVPSDKYDDAVRAMEERIRKGQISGVTDPKEAKNIVRKGRFTYEQAKNVARFGTVESLTYDAVNGAIIGSASFGITAAMTFAVSIWNGEDFENAIEGAITSGLQVGGLAFATAIVSGQLAKSSVNGVVSASSAKLVSLMGPKASAVLVNAFRSGTNIYGAAAMKSAQKLLGSNIVTSVASVIVLSSMDVVNIFRGRISGAQLFKNLVNTGASVAGGTAGWAAGASAGAALGSIVPGVGTAIGGVVGGLFGAFAGGSAAGKVASAVTDEFIEDDAKEMIAIIESRFKSLAEDYLLNKEEAEKVVEYLAQDLDGSILKDMYASSSRSIFANNLLVPNIEIVVRSRTKISMPSEEQMIKGLKSVLEKAGDE